MSEKPSATDMVAAMIEATKQAETADDMPKVGTFARYYGDAHREDIDGENVEVFLHGSAIINLLVQEAILKVTRVANETATKVAESEVEEAYAAGVQEGAMLIAQLMAAHADDLIRHMIEGPAFDRAFQHIVQNYK